MDITILRSKARSKVSRQLTSSEYPDTEVDVNLNIWYQRVLGWVIPLGSSWELQGNILVRDFLAGITNYDLPATLISVYKGEVAYENGGSYVPISKISIRDNQGTAEGNSTRLIDDVTKPTLELFDKYAEIRPAPSADVTNGIKLWAQIAFTDLDSSTNPIPNLLQPVQKVLYLGAAFEFADGEGMERKAASIQREIFGNPRVKNDNGLKGEIEEIYSANDLMSRDQIGVRRGRWN